MRARGLEEYASLLRTLERWLDETANYLLDRPTSRFAEGFNNQVKALKRRCYAIFHVGRLFQRQTLDVRGYACCGAA